jgi:EmrB/QacA subfamily drug resistance transporter
MLASYRNSAASMTAQHKTDAVAPPKTNLRVILAGLMLVMGLAAMDQSIVNTALPRITADLGGVAHLSWVVTAFMLTSTVTTPLYGKLSDMYGRRLMILSSIAVFLTGSILCGAAQSMLQLIMFRALQGLGAGGLMTLSQTIIGDVVSPRERPRYQGLFTGVFAISSLAGPLIGGGLTTALSWRWVFYVNLPLGAVALTLILMGLNKNVAGRRHAIDYTGALLLTTATSALLLLLSWGISQTGSPLPAMGLGAVAIVGAWLFFVQERRAPEPILSLALFRNRTFAVGATATAVMAFAMMGALVFLPVYLQLAMGQSPIQAGLIVMPQIVGMMLSSIFGGRAVSRLGRVKPFLMGGVFIEASALWALAIAAAFAAPTWVFSIVTFSLGTGMGIGMPNAVTAVQNSMKRENMGVATGVMGFVRSLGGTLGVTLAGAVMSFVLHRITGGAVDAGQMHALLHQGAVTEAHQDLASAYRHAIEASFFMSGVIMSGAFALVCTLPNDNLRERESLKPAS